MGRYAGLLLVLLFGCTAATEEPAATVDLPVGNHTFTVEIADDEEERARGLMFRDSLPEDGGMLFVFPSAEPRSFWMKNTRIPLSIAYINSRGEILEIYPMEPLSTDPVPSRYPAQYALEVRQGRFGEVGVTIGDTIDLTALPRWVDPR
ncbi:MAG: DUF192 domain-containing protein [Alkalispirochaeta sp.]